MRERQREGPKRAESDPGDGPLLALEEGLGFRVSRLARHLRREWALQLKPLGVTPPQAAILRGVAHEPGCSLRGLARTLGADPMNVKRCVDELEKMSLIRSGRDEVDRRPRTLFLTERGGEAARQIGSLAMRQQDELVRFTGLDLIDGFHAALERLEASLQIGSVSTRPGADHRAYDGDASVADGTLERMRKDVGTRD